MYEELQSCSLACGPLKPSLSLTLFRYAYVIIEQFCVNVNVNASGKYPLRLNGFV